MRNNFVVYKSSAGSGKTYTLVKEYLKLALADPQRINRAFRQILAVTFTNKAAAEMKERILSALQKISGGENIPLAKDLQKDLNVSEDELAARCEELHTHLLHQYADFSVCTIDSFVYRIVRRFSLDLKLPANFSVETDEETALWWAIDTLLTDMQQNKAIETLLKEYAEEKVTEQKNWKIENEIFDLAKSVLIAKKDEATGLLGQQEIDGLLEVKKLLAKKIREVEDHLTLLANKAFVIIAAKEVAPDDFKYGKSGMFSYFKKLREGEYADEELLKSRLLEAIYEDKWYTGKGPNLIDGVKQDLIGLFHTIEEYRKKNGPSYYLHLSLRRNINALCVLSELKILVDKYKAEKNIVFISEFNKAVSSFIRNEPVPFIYERLGDRYKNYLIDEFQDTSILQWLNLLPLVHNSLSEGRFCMLVGDGKQSIYRWRGADVEQFVKLPHIDNREKSNWIEEQQQALLANYEERYLTTNRRSCFEIVSFNNRLFDFLADNYLEGDYKKVYDKAAQQATETQPGKVSFTLLKKQKEAAEEKMLSKTLDIIERSRKNNYTYSDIAVLVRSNYNGNKIANYLLQNGVPVVSSDSLLLKNCPEINFMISFLSWLINRHDAVSATAVLSYIRQNPASAITHDLLKENANSPLGMEKIFTSLGIDFRPVYLAGLSLYELCTEVIRLFKLEEKDPLYLNFFLDEISNYSLRENNSVFSFLQWWKLKANSLSVKIPQNTNAVKILSIHASKGLEFPVVIFPFADWQVQKPDSILIDTHEQLPELPVALVKSDSTLKKTEFKEQAIDEEQKQTLDSLNLLYVACTRAEEELHIISRETRSVSVAGWLKNFVDNMYAEQTQEEVTTIGESVPRSESKIKEFPFIKASKYRPLHEAVTIKLSDSEDSSQSRRMYGIALHNILAEVRTEETIMPVLQKALLQGNLNGSQVNQLQKVILELVRSPKISPYFSPEVDIRTETELFTNEGEVIRPDRVVICPDHLAVIDFKTGEKKKEHIKQIEQYKYTLAGISRKPVKAYLIYFPLDIVEVK